VLAFLIAGLVHLCAADMSTVSDEKAAITPWLNQAAASLALVEKCSPRPALAARLKNLTERATSANGPVSLHEVRALRRDIILSHPALDFDAILLTERPTAANGHMGDYFFGRNSRAGPGLVLLKSWKKDAKPVFLTRDQLPAGTVANPDLSYDGTRAVFSFCDHSQMDGNRRCFHLCEIGLDGKGLRRLTGTGRDAEEGRWGRKTQLVEDFMPVYLPDGGIVFASTRNMVTVRCANSTRYNPSFVLYRCAADGSDVRPISYGELNEYPSAIMPDGRLLYTRWEYINRDITVLHGLWTTRADGTNVQHVYGNSTVDPNLIIEGRPIPGSRKLVANASAHHNRNTGTIILVDPDVAEDGLRPLTLITPEVGFPESKNRNFLLKPLIPDENGIFPYGLPYRLDEPVAATASKPLTKGHQAYMRPFPLSEDLFLVSHRSAEHGDRWGIWLIDTTGGRELIYLSKEADCGAFDPIPVQPRPKTHVPPPPPPQVKDSETASGVFTITDVYQNRFDRTGAIARGSVKRLRVNQIFDQPTTRACQVSRVLFETPKRVLGTVPVEADGSVAFRAPAGVPLQFQLLDDKGMAVMTMRSFVYLQPGETNSCVGCHEPRQATPSAAPRATRRQVRDLEPEPWDRGPDGFSFPRQVQPILDRHCIVCHGLDGKTPVPLVGTLRDQEYPQTGISTNWPGSMQLIANESYHQLLGKSGLVVIAQAYNETSTSKPRDYFAHAGKLVPLLDAGHYKVKLAPDERQRIVDWLDLNAVFAGSYSWNRLEFNTIAPDGEKALRDHLRTCFPALADQPIAALVNAAAPEESRVLKAPLAVAAGGWGQMATGGWGAITDAGYQTMLTLVMKTVVPSPFHDIAGTCGRGAATCVCGSCGEREFIEAEAKARR
jgi:hypothetical protein